jgi:hypothetical protein
MENWGLVTFREAALLYDPALTSSVVKQRITLVVSHEVGHFWFGNLVTMVCFCSKFINNLNFSLFSTILSIEMVVRFVAQRGICLLYGICFYQPQLSGI